MKRKRVDMAKLAEAMGTKGGGAWDTPYGEIAGLTALQSRVLWAVNFDAIEMKFISESDGQVGHVWDVPTLDNVNVVETMLQLEAMKLVMLSRSDLLVVRRTRYILTDAGRLKL